MPRGSVTSAEVERVTRADRQQTRDLIAVEEPLQIIVEHGELHDRAETPLAMTMRTPGHDIDLVNGFLFAEGVITSADDLVSVRHCMRTDAPGNVVRAVLRDHVVVPPRLLERTLTVTSACGVCGDRTVEALSDAGCRVISHTAAHFRPRAVVVALEALDSSQSCFRHTGGTHGAALFDDNGTLLLLREDVGRHNALDKLIGAGLLGRSERASSCFVVVSSRASFELVQKAVRARVPMMVAMGAPTSLAIRTAKRFGLTLIGFAKTSRLNVYSLGQRLVDDPAESSLIEVGAAE